MGALYEYRDAQIYCHHSRNEVPDPRDYPMHAHEGAEIFCFLSGEGNYRVEGNEYPLCPRDILIMRPAETHKLLISPSAPYERVALHFAPSLLGEEWKELLTPFYARPLGVGNRYAAKEYPGLADALTDLDFTGCRMERAHIFARLMRFLAALSDTEQTGWPPVKEYPASLVEYVNEALFEELSLSRIAERFRKSTSQISRDFRRATGVSVWDYVMLKRLYAARAMLRRGEGAQRTSEACGFGDYSSFYRAYRTKFGISPKNEKKEGG